MPQLQERPLWPSAASLQGRRRMHSLLPPPCTDRRSWPAAHSARAPNPRTCRSPAAAEQGGALWRVRDARGLLVQLHRGPQRARGCVGAARGRCGCCGSWERHRRPDVLPEGPATPRCCVAKPARLPTAAPADGSRNARPSCRQPIIHRTRHACCSHAPQCSSLRTPARTRASRPTRTWRARPSSSSTPGRRSWGAVSLLCCCRVPCCSPPPPPPPAAVPGAAAVTPPSRAAPPAPPDPCAAACSPHACPLAGGHRYGTLCVVDLKRRAFSAEMYALLINFANLVVQGARTLPRAG